MPQPNGNMVPPGAAGYISVEPEPNPVIPLIEHDIESYY